MKEISVDVGFTINTFELTMIYLILISLAYLFFYLGYRCGSRSDYEARQARENTKLLLHQWKLTEPLVLKARERVKRTFWGEGSPNE